MSAVIDYYFTPISGYAYLGHKALCTLAEEAGAQVRYFPMQIAKVFEATGTTPPAAQSETRRRYRVEDQARWAGLRGLPMSGKPAFWPTDPSLACAVILAAEALGVDQSTTSFACLQAVWADDLNIADARQLVLALHAAGLPAPDLLERAQLPQTQEQVEAVTAAAIEAQVFGSPTVIVNGERFWGQDRLEFVRASLLRVAA